MVMNCLVVDDEPIARRGLLEYIQEIDYLHAAGECRNAAEAAGMMEKEDIDLLFLDIQMPRLTGLELIKTLPHPPLTVLVTAYPQYALESFDLDVLDYLVKPVAFGRFLKATEKARQAYSLRKTRATDRSYFFIKCNGKIEKIITADVLYIESMGNYVIIHTRSKKYITYLTISGMEAQLPQDLFVRIHKSYIVAFHAILTIDGAELNTEGGALPISKYLRAGVMEKIEAQMYKR